MRTDILASRGVRTHDPSVRVGVHALDPAATVIGGDKTDCSNYQVLSILSNSHKSSSNIIHT
jgi:hypothetical protein